MALKGQFTWKEAAAWISLTVPLKGCPPRNVDIYATDSIIKINYVPFLIDITLKHAIKPGEHKARVKDGVLTIVVQKEHEGLWGELEADPATEDIEERRNQSILRQQELENQKKQKQLDRKHEDSRKALRKQMAIEEGERQLLDDLKSEEKRQAEEEMYAALAQIRSTNSSKVDARQPVSSITRENEAVSLLDEIDEEDDHDDDHDDEEEEVTGSSNSTPAPQSAEPTMFDDVTELASYDANDDFAREDGDNGAELHFIPPPRSETRPNNKHTIDFTPRIFPTPLRESKVAEEEDWMVRNRRYLKDHGVLGKHISRANGVDIEEEDPTWLKAKGDDFYRNGDFRSAINAYTAALDIDPKHVACLVNRGACYLQVGGEASHCVSDCTTALQLISEAPPAMDTMGNPISRPENTKQQVKILTRRAAAHCQNEDFPRALEDFRSALALISVSSVVAIPAEQIEQLRQDLHTVELLSVCDAHKKAGNAALAQGDLTQATQEYTMAIDHIPTHIACLSNRAACHMANENFEACLADCSAALELLQQAPSVQSKGSGIDLHGCIVPAPGTEKRRQWVLRTLTRKAASLVKLSRIQEAIECYEMALVLAPNDQNLAADLRLLQASLPTAKIP